jgi:hypothetical protein
VTRCPHCRRRVQADDLADVHMPGQSGPGWTWSGCTRCIDDVPGLRAAREQAERISRFLERVRARRGEAGPS